MPVLLELFLTFAKIGLFTFGGGYAMISLIEDACVSKKQWITHEDMMNMTVIAESTPGPIAINCATFIGYKQRGFIGSVVSTIGIVLPSFFVILLISSYLDRFLEIIWVANAFKGIKIAVGILILDAGIKMVQKMQKNALSKIFVIASFIMMMIVNIFALRISTIVLMLAAGAVSLLLFMAAKPGATDKGGGA